MELEKQLEQEKQLLRDSLSTLGSRAGDAVDWRQQVRKRPLGALGLAAAVGVAIGAMASRSGRSEGARIVESNGGSARRADRSNGSPEWQRLKAGLIGVLADRALVMANEAMKAVTRRAP